MRTINHRTQKNVLFLILVTLIISGLLSLTVNPGNALAYSWSKWHSTDPSSTETSASTTDTASVTAAPSGWTNTSFTKQTDDFTAQFDVTPNQDNADLVVGFSSAAADSYSDLATAIRFNPKGTIDARDGNRYRADASLTYGSGSAFHVRMEVNMAAHTYSVFVTPQGKAEIALAADYSFRSEQALVSSLANIAALGADTPSIRNFVIGTPTPEPVPSTEWTNTSFAQQTGDFTAEFDAKPATDNGDVVVGMAQTAADAYSDLATVIRFNTDGSIDVRNGDRYTSDTAMSYRAGTGYHIRMVVDTAAHTYSVFVTPQGGSETKLAADYSFRSEQASVSSLADLAEFSGGNGAVTVSNFAIGAQQTADTSAPTQPTGLSATAVSTSEIDLSWSASSDNVGVVGYRVYRNGSQIGTTANASYKNTGLTASTAYSYTVKAFDAAGNLSINSATASATTKDAAVTPPPTNGWPDATNTGVPAGITLSKSGSMTISTPGAVVSGVDVSGTITITANNVTLKNCKVTSGSYDVILIKPGVTGAIVEDCEINNLSSGGQGIAGQGTFLRNNIHDSADGIDVRGDNTLIQDNYIHGMSGTSDSHFDSIQADGSFSNLTVRHNTIINEKSQTSAMMLDNYWGPIDHVVIDNNRLIGGGYTVYLDEVAGQGGTVTNVSLTNNRLGKGYYGYLDLRTQLGFSPTISGNVDDVTGEALNL